MAKIKSGDSSRATLDSLLANSIIVPKGYSLKNKWYTLDGKVRKEGLLIDSLSIKNESSVTVGWKNAGFLGLRKEPMVEIKNTNPYLSVEKMSNVVVKKKKGLFQNPIFWIGVGVVGGHLIK
jgi:N-acetylmuramoyl-L-alanine amidase CwlA